MAAKKPTGAIADIFADLDKGKRKGNVQYLKDGMTMVKLLLPKGETDIRKFYRSFMTLFKDGKDYQYYLVCGVITECDEDGVEDRHRIRYIKVTGATLREIVTLMQLKWELFSLESPQVAITKGNKNGKTGYSVSAVMEKFDATGLEYPDQTIDEAAAEQYAIGRDDVAVKEDLPF